MNKLGQSLYGIVAMSMALSGLPACSDSEDDAQETSVSEGEARGGGRTRAGGKDTGAKPSAPAAAQDLVATAMADGRFTILAKALTDADLVATLQGAGPFTVFAPPDSAFEALGQATLSALTPEQLKTILTYHVVAGDLPSTALKAGPVATASGLTAFVSIADGTVKVNDATVTTADVRASNGVIHVVDKVLLPPNLVQAAQYAGSFSTLLGAATQAGLADALTAPDANLTVFAPTDAAFAAIADTVAGLSTSQLADVLKYHVVAGKVLSTSLSAGPVPTLLGQNVDVSLTDGVRVNDANVIAKDVVTTNGVIHVIDKVLVPSL